MFWQSGMLGRVIPDLLSPQKGFEIDHPVPSPGLVPIPILEPRAAISMNVNGSMSVRGNDAMGSGGRDGGTDGRVEDVRGSTPGEAH